MVSVRENLFVMMVPSCNHEEHEDLVSSEKTFGYVDYPIKSGNDPAKE